MASELRVDKIIPTAGVPTGGGGGIVQTIIGTDNREQINFNTASETTLMTATITPKSTSNSLINVLLINKDIFVLNAIFLTSPTDAPSGVSAGHIIPN